MTNPKKIKIYGLLLIVAIILLAVAINFFNSKVPKVINDNDQIEKTTATTENSSPLADIKTPTPEITAPAPETAVPAPKNPNLLNLQIPFTPQAPTGNWDKLHNEACEEASAIMANAYLTGDRNAVIPATRVEKEISDLTVWQDKNLGYHLDSTTEETARMIEGFYGLQAKVFNDYTLADIKRELNLQHVVILPVNGRVIGNPNYKQPGPIYHMLVIRGYTETKLITNDSGTRLGQNYSYAFKTLYSAGADWDHKTDTIDQSKKLMIVVSK
ncbi:MAG: C39 family peptidase [bacterium]|nr:C39 family peptidase [bacterium]